MSDPAAAEALTALADTIRNIILTKYTYVAAATLLVWDILLTFDHEISRVWLTQRSIGKTLFLVNRYVAPVLFAFDLTFQLHPSPSLVFCKRSFLPSALLGIVALTIVQFVLVMRTYALYQSKFLFVVLSFLCFISGVTMMTVSIYIFMRLMTWVPAGTLPFVPGCLPQCTDPICRTLLTTFWIPFFIVETLIFLLTVYKSFRSFKDVGLMYSSNFVTIVYRDGLIYYVVIMAISIVNLIVWIVASISLTYIATSFMRCLQVTIVSRLLLNIRGMLEREFVQATQLTSMTFQEPSRMQISTKREDDVPLDLEY